ncbi:HAMP domain-containing sensor histidine kinase [Nocardioides sp. BP30]|uniref:sensor histidine kinase n=1 Tax=Nocardioides sp. BP30 TaxID=3036374 RepID=UPI00246896B4|nr:HAMP domain-containing sensor histidine kinase [Nocardioides sp. BP30]WGL52496.1 HAMP domain-containing sensor histidine kinase [Nocardioides sp. BP30]
MSGRHGPTAPSPIRRLAAWGGFGGDSSTLRRRLVTLTAVFASTVAILLILVIQVALSRSSHSAVARVLEDRADAVISSASSASSSRTLSVPDARLDPGVAVYDTAGRLVAGVVPPSQARFFADLSTSSTTRRAHIGDAFALLAQPFTTPSGVSGVVVVSERLDSYQDIIHDALAIAIGIGATIVVLATLLVAWASRRALVPVALMAHTAEAWSEHDLDRRFDLGPPTDEIRALGHTLDRLLDRVRRAILDEQRLTSELAHELRTPLTAVLATAEVISDRDDLDAELREDLGYITDSCREMAATITGLVELARSTSTGARADDADLASVIHGLLRDLAGGDRVQVDLAADLCVAVAPTLAARAVAPVLENAIRHAEHVEVVGVRREDWISLLVADNGPGIDDADLDVIFTPGHTGSGGSGLGLALARRVARSVGGDVTLRPHAPSGGATFEIRLPAAAPALGEDQHPKDG